MQFLTDLLIELGQSHEIKGGNF